MSTQTPRQAGFRQPPEWTPHDACWVAFPSHPDLWEEHFEPVRKAVRDLILAIADPDPQTGARRGELPCVLVLDDESEQAARAALGELDVRYHRIPFGDIWLRDTAPVFLTAEHGRRLAPLCFRFNGWGGKYILPHDSEVAPAIAQTGFATVFHSPLILEGGSVEVDGDGTILTTRQCLLNPNRNPGLDKRAIERALSNNLGGTRVLWIDEGLANDHTDGHIDTIVRFIAPGVVAAMTPSGPDDPNREVLENILRELATMKDARGRSFEIIRLPSPGRIEDEEGNVMPASYVNFYIANTTIIIPTYDSPWDAQAVSAIGRLFPTRRAVGIRARELLAGGGAFHCITQQQPRAGRR